MALGRHLVNTFGNLIKNLIYFIDTQKCGQDIILPYYPRSPGSVLAPVLASCEMTLNEISYISCTIYHNIKCCMHHIHAHCITSVALNTQVFDLVRKYSLYAALQEKVCVYHHPLATTRTRLMPGA